MNVSTQIHLITITDLFLDPCLICLSYSQIILCYYTLKKSWLQFEIIFCTSPLFFRGRPPQSNCRFWTFSFFLWLVIRYNTGSISLFVFFKACTLFLKLLPKLHTLTKETIQNYSKRYIGSFRLVVNFIRIFTDIPSSQRR